VGYQAILCWNRVVRTFFTKTGSSIGVSDHPQTGSIPKRIDGFALVHDGALQLGRSVEGASNDLGLVPQLGRRIHVLPVTTPAPESSLGAWWFHTVGRRHADICHGRPGPIPFLLDSFYIYGFTRNRTSDKNNTSIRITCNGFTTGNESIGL
jgi:hypothetical protein